MGMPLKKFQKTKRGNWMKILMTILSIAACVVLMIAVACLGEDEQDSNVLAKNILLMITTVIALDVVCMWN